MRAGGGGTSVQQRLQDVYERFPRLAERRRQKAHTLSGGERQMLALGRALMAQPVLLMLDEPSLGLAPLIVREIFRIVASLRDAGVSILLVEQNARAALETADYGYVLETGEITYQGPAADAGPRPARERDLSRRIGVMARGGYGDVVLAAPVTVPYVRYSIRGAHWFLGRALAQLLAVAKIPKQRVDGLAVASFTLAPDTAVGLTQHLGLTLRWLDNIPMGGASAVVSIRRAARAVQNGDAEIVACVAGDTNHTDSFRRNTSAFSQFAQDAVYPYGSGGPNTSFALLTSYYMRTYGAKREDFGKLCVAQRNNALKNPLALFKKPLTLDQYLNARLVAEPLRLFDCVMPCAGAEGFLVMREDTARDLGLPFARLLAAIERHNAFPDDPIQYRGGWAMDRAELYVQAGLMPADIDFIEVYDDYPVINVLQFEDLGFCSKGEGPDFIRANTFEIDGTFPCNTSGGQLSVGQAGAAGGHLGAVEAIRQLTGQTLGAPVAGRQIWTRFGIRHDQLRSRHLQRRRRARRRLMRQREAKVAEATMRAKRKNPILRTPLPTLPPQQAQPRCARPYGCRRARGTRTASLPRLRRCAVSAARSLS